MIETIHDAMTVLKAAGLAVSVTSFNSLQIGRSLEEVGEGIHMFRDGSALNPRKGDWVALLPAEGLMPHEIPGTLADGVSLIIAVYQEHRQNGGLFKDACKRVLKDADHYLIGRSLAGV